jgi:sortase (surface protein transpeptidase)
VSAADEAAPLRLQVPSAGIDTALSAVGLDDTGTLVPPDAPGTAGWFADGPAPGDPGPAVIAGHVDGPYGPAVFYRLRDVAVGDAILVARSDGSTGRFTVTRVARSPKSAFPTGEVYGPTPGAELRLITCGGEFDRAAGSYRDNVVVYARAVGPG